MVLARWRDDESVVGPMVVFARWCDYLSAVGRTAELALWLLARLSDFMFSQVIRCLPHLSHQNPISIFSNNAHSLIKDL